jgi:hypothetical protein
MCSLTNKYIFFLLSSMPCWLPIFFSKLLIKIKCFRLHSSKQKYVKVVGKCRQYPGIRCEPGAVPCRHADDAVHASAGAACKLNAGSCGDHTAGRFSTAPQKSRNSILVIITEKSELHPSYHNIV